MRNERKAFLFSLLREFTVPKTVFFLFTILLVGNLSALVDAVLHPDIPYFDEEHLIIGGVYALLLSVMFLVLAVYVTKLKMSARTQAASEKNYRNIFDQARDIIFTLDRDTLFTSLNLAFEKITGWHREEWLGRSFAPMLYPEDLSKAMHLLQKIMQGEALDIFQLRVLKKSGEYFTGEFTVAPVKQGETVIALGHVRDITERKLNEEKIRMLTGDLELKVQERTRQLLEAQDELVRREKLAILGQLAGSVGHELRNPLGVISNAVYFLQTVMPDADERVREYLGIIKSEVSTAERIITDLLDFTRTKTPRFESVPVSELMNRGLAKCMIPENIALQLDLSETLPMVKVDPLHMEQIMQNLITNAIQAMPDGGELRISARIAVPPNPVGNFIEISVSDTGGGIAPEIMSKLFQPLFSTKARGIGLGLIVSKNLAEANGGRIEVESCLGKGTTFTLILPAAGNRQ